MHITKIIKYPLLTEKNYQKINDGYYTFAVHPKATKSQIKEAFQTIFEVKVDTVNTVIMKPKTKKVGRYSGLTNTTKKAIIKLMPGEQLDIFGESKKG